MEDTVVHQSHQRLIDEQVKGASRLVHTAVLPLPIKPERLYVTNTNTPGHAIADINLVLIDHFDLLLLIHKLPTMLAGIKANPADSANPAAIC